MNKTKIGIVCIIVIIVGISITPQIFSETVIENVETYIENQTIATQNVSSSESDSDIIDLFVKEGIGIVASILGVGVGAIVAWLRKRGIPVTSEQEAMFKEIVTKRFEKLAKQSWIDMRNNPEKLDKYWDNFLRNGKIPDEFVQRLKTEGKEFALELKNNREFRDFAKKITENGIENLLTDLRAQLKSNYQKRMIDVLPKLASIAVDAAFDEKTKDVETWSKKSLENLKPLLLSSEALDTEENLMIIIKSEINKRRQKNPQ